MPSGEGKFNFNAGSIPANWLAGDIDPTVKERQLSYRHFGLSLLDWRVHDAINTLIGTPGNDDLGVDGGTFGTSTPYISAGDLKAAGPTTRYARKLIWLPPNYDDGATAVLRLAAGMLTNAADNTATLDVDAYLFNESTGITGSNLYTGSAQDMNSETFAELDFEFTNTALVRGSMIDVRIAIACNDAATGTAVTPAIAAAWLACDTKG